MDDVELTERMNETERVSLFSQIASTCESGWDFSSRWMAGSYNNLTTLQTNKIAPVDLNSMFIIHVYFNHFYFVFTKKCAGIMYKNENTLAKLHAILGDEKLQHYYLDNAAKRCIHKTIYIVYYDIMKCNK